MSDIYRNNNLLIVTRNLRKNMTRQEKHLWYDFLRNYPLHWYKQRIIDNFVVDFYCPKAKLAVELDGSQHFEEEGIEYDKERTAVINSYGIEVLRFSNYDVDKSFECVCIEIDKAVKRRTE